MQEHSRGVAELRRLYVAERHRRRGLATRLLAEAERFARAARYERHVLETACIQTAAIALYRAHSYVGVGREIAAETSSRTVGEGMSRLSMSKRLD